MGDPISQSNGASLRSHHGARRLAFRDRQCKRGILRHTRSILRCVGGLVLYFTRFMFVCRNVMTYRLDGDKGFNYSQVDKAFVCQKKNHFQITGCVSLSDTPKYAMTPEGPKPIDGMYMHFYGVKVSPYLMYVRGRRVALSISCVDVSVTIVII